MRTICCQSRLLVRQKLRQYIGLVDMVESNSGEKKTTREDLQVSTLVGYYGVGQAFPLVTPTIILYPIPPSLSLHHCLQGFWDMVYFQVDGLYTRFGELADMESAGWQLDFPSPKKPKIQVTYIMLQWNF